MTKIANFQLAKKADSAPEILIYDDIGPSLFGMIDGKTVLKALKDIGDVPEITVRINSPGGDVFEGFLIYNLLVNSRAKINVEIDALAASAAGLIAMAGDTVKIAENAMLMIHNCWCWTAGNSAEHRKQAGLLDQIDANQLATFVKRTGLPEAEVKAMIDNETWLSASEAIDKGFVDAIGTPLAVSAKVAAGRFTKTPPQFVAAAEEPAEEAPEAELKTPPTIILPQAPVNDAQAAATKPAEPPRQNVSTYARLAALSCEAIERRHRFAA